MTMLTELLSNLHYRLRALVHRDTLEQELDDELRFHLEQEAEKLVRAGLSPDEAARQARLAFGGVDRTKEESRDARGLQLLDTLQRDLHYAARTLRRSPGFTSAVVLTLALGLGANTTMFGVVDRLLFRPPPYMPDPGSAHRVYLLRSYRGKETANDNMQYARYLDLARWTRSFSDAAAFADRELAVGVGDAAREMHVGVVSASFFGFFDAPPALGRYFSEREDTPPDGTPVAVLSWAMWQTHFGGRQDVLGTKLQVGPTLYTVIGVAPQGFVGLWPEKPPAILIPITTFASDKSKEFKLDKAWYESYQWNWMSMIVRRRPGVSVQVANADLTNAFRRSYEASAVGNPGAPPITVAHPRALASSILSERGPNESAVARVATWLAGVAVIVLLIACANVANLLLARALRRRREIAVRLALGVSRARLLSQLLTESILLALLGGVAGVLVAHFGGAVLQAALFPNTAAATVLGDRRTLFFAGLAALLAGLLTGLAPAVQARHVDLSTALKSGAREGTYQHSRTRAALIVVQVALSVVLLVGAGLFVRSLRHVRAVPLGYDVDPVLVVDLNMRGMTLDSAHAGALRQRLLETAQATPGVEAAALNSSLPFYNEWVVELFVAGIDSVSRLGTFDLNAVTPGYFRTIGTHILRGRGITEQDVATAPGAMVVSEAMAKTLWPGRDPIGQCVKVRADTLPCTYVVGVAENIKAQSLDTDPGLYYYLARAQFHPEQGGLLVRTRGDASHLAASVRRRLQLVMPGISYITVTPFSDIVGPEMRSWRLGTTMFLVFGVLALVLAAVGLYGVIAYTVAQRSHEIGVRIALGAGAGDVLGLVVGQAVSVAGAGVVIGGALALTAGRWLEPLLFREPPTDPVVFAGVAGTLLLAALAASTVPALRASRTDPNVALRTE